MTDQYVTPEMLGPLGERAAADQDLWSIMSTARAVRRFTDEPVPDDVLDRCLQAATWAPSGGNFQAWRFVVLRSPEVRAGFPRS